MHFMEVVPQDDTLSAGTPITETYFPAPAVDQQSNHSAA